MNIGSPSSTIYAIVDQEGRTRYVGRTTYPVAERFAHHRSARTAVGSWLRDEGRDARAVVLETLDGRPWVTGVYPGDRERHWIEHYRADGHCLFNVWPMKAAA